MLRVKDFSAVRSEIIDSLQSFLSDCLAIDDDLETAVNALRPEQISNLDNVRIRLIHRILPDFKLREVSQYLKIVSETVQEANQLTSSQLLKKLLPQNADYRPMCIALARNVSTMPHSMDVERIISSYNLIKAIDRSSLSSDTIKDYLVVRHNMPCVAQFDVRPAVEEWNKRVRRKPHQNRDIAKFVSGICRNIFLGHHTKQLIMTHQKYHFNYKIYYYHIEVDSVKFFKF